MKDLFIGFNANGEKIWLTDEERALHMHKIGSTGSGKSKSMEWDIRGDIFNRAGLCLIDPHGFLYDDIVKWCAYHWILDREIILLNPSAGDYVTGFNPFVRIEGEKDLSVQVDSKITATIKAWGVENTNETPTLERWLRCIYFAILEKDATILDAQYLINYYENDVREFLTSGLSKPIIQGEWQELKQAKTPKDFNAEILSTKNRLFRFLCSDTIQRFMGLRQNNINIREIMDQGKILLVNLKPSDDHLSPENANLFGTLLVNAFFETARRREKDEFGNLPRSFYLYIDEFQNFLTPDINYIFAQGRKMGLHLILANQDFDQLEGKIKLKTLMTNAKIKQVFGGLCREDAQYLVENMFVDQLNLEEIKHITYSTKFWPVYGRDKVYSSSSGGSAGEALQQATSTGSSTQFSNDGFLSNIAGWAQTDASLSGSSKIDVSAYSDAVADIPILLPEPFEEATNIEHWSREDQIWRMSDCLMDQYTRHCFVKIINKKTQPMLVPKVKEYQVFQCDIKEYQEVLYEKCSLPLDEVDKLIEERRRKLLDQVRDSQTPKTKATTSKQEEQEEPTYADIIEPDED